MALKKEKVTPIEKEARELRNKVFGQISTNDNWEKCRGAWMSEEGMKWLKEQIKKQNNEN